MLCRCIRRTPPSYGKSPGLCISNKGQPLPSSRYPRHPQVQSERLQALFLPIFVTFYVVVDVSQLRVFLHDVRSRLQSSVFVGDRSHVDSLDLIGLGLQANLFEEVGDLMVMGLELFQNEGNQFEGRNAVDIDLAAGGVPLLYESEGKHDDVGEPVHHLVMTYNRQALKEMRRQGFLVLQVLRLLTYHSLQQKHCKLIDGGNVVLETQT